MKKKLFYGWWIVLASSLICLLGYGTWLYGFGVFFKPMAAEFGWSRALVAGAYSLRSVEGGIAGPLVGWAVDKFGSRVVIQWGAVISGTGFALMYFVDSILGFYLVYAVWLSVGMSAMLYIPSDALIVRWFDRRLSFALAVVTAGVGMSGLICTPLLSWLLLRVGWRYAFITVGIVVWVVVLPLSLLIKNRPEEVGLKPDGEVADGELENRARTAGKALRSTDRFPAEYTLTQALRSRLFWVLACAFGFALMSHAVVTVHTIPALTDVGISPQKAAFAFGMIIFVSIAGRLLFGYLGDLWDIRYLFVAAYCLQGAGILVLMNARDLASVSLFIALFGVGFGATVPLMPAIRRGYFGLKAFAKIQGFMTPIILFFSALGPIAAGYVFDVSGSYRWGFLLVAITMFLAALMLLLLLPSKDRLAR
ncbi:MAG: MFS transporter [Deltaproteobacteria bacterium]|nr:MFS transporter [Deltaproteobacteria bacterium]